MSTRPRPESVLYLGDDMDKMCESVGVLPCTARHPKGRTLSEPNFETEHYEVYRLAGITWPPKVLLGYERFAGFGTRLVQAAIFVDKTWKASMLFEFVDLHHSLGKLTGFKSGDSFEDLKNPWQEYPSTVTATSKFAVRYSRNGCTVVRPLESFEVLGLVGWSQSFFKPGASYVPSHDVAVSLAGNAFSVFACVPATLALLVAAGTPSTEPRPESEASDDDL